MPRSITLHCKDFKVQKFVNGTERHLFERMRDSSRRLLESVVGQETRVKIRVYTADMPREYPWLYQNEIYVSKVYVTKNTVSFTSTWKKPKS